MKRMAALPILFFLLSGLQASPYRFPTLKIEIKGDDLTTPIQITDGKVLADFQVFSGRGTYTNEPRLEEPSFIIDWSQGSTVEPPNSLPRYEISFYVDRHNERLVYVVSYVFDAVTGNGYVYLPGKNDKNYTQNVHTVIRGVEGKWFHSWARWDSVVQRLVQSRRGEQSPGARTAAEMVEAVDRMCALGRA